MTLSNSYRSAFLDKATFYKRVLENCIIPDPDLMDTGTYWTLLVKILSSKSSEPSFCQESGVQPLSTVNGSTFLYMNLLTDPQSRTKLNGTPCRVAEKRLFLPPFPLFNVPVVLSRTLAYMLTYNIDLGDGGRWKVTLLN